MIFVLHTLVVALTQTTKKTREHKNQFIQQIRTAIDEYDDVYLFSFTNMRSNHFQSVRTHFATNGNKGRLFLGKNKLMQLALGKTLESEYNDNLHQLGMRITGAVGLLLTSDAREAVELYFSELAQRQHDDFARAGAIAPRTVVLTEDMVASHPISMVEQFRKLKVPVEIKNGRVALADSKTQYTLAKQGETLSAEQCKALMHFGIKLAEFRVKLKCRWSNGEFEILDNEGAMEP